MVAISYVVREFHGASADDCPREIAILTEIMAVTVGLTGEKQISASRVSRSV